MCVWVTCDDPLMDVDTVGELETLLGVEAVPSRFYPDEPIDRNSCLCLIDVKATIRKSGWDWEEVNVEDIRLIKPATGEGRGA